MNTRKNKKTHRPRIYTLKNYMSGDGMMTSVWGPSMWHVLHIISFNYPTHPTTDDKHIYKKFITDMVHILPCKYCRSNLKNNFKKHPLTMDKMNNRDTFSRYIYDLHEVVNTMLKKESKLSYCDVRERYESFRSRCLEKNAHSAHTILGNNRTKKNKKGETGCTEPLWGKKSKCILHIVPRSKKVKTFTVDKNCIPKRK